MPFSNPIQITRCPVEITKRDEFLNSNYRFFDRKIDYPVSHPPELQNPSNYSGPLKALVHKGCLNSPLIIDLIHMEGWGINPTGV
ncbi:hypothetical protein TNCV_1664351 [Trichonephila clavipes]|uniref:Uncharacterized protein n=1 Tax=Trichonephila clavipes TaxID=2585209 RepID=A0A8X6S1N0_TRICX|nr:hypothetical protein TNCV_1664351 [Trichonephila clavipes]